MLPQLAPPANRSPCQRARVAGHLHHGREAGGSHRVVREFQRLRPQGRRRRGGQAFLGAGAPAADLPLPVQKYLEATRSAHNPRFKVATLRQRGRLRAAADKPWIPFEAEQLYSIRATGLRLVGQRPDGLGLALLAPDKFIDGKGDMLISLLFPIADARAGRSFRCMQTDPARPRQPFLPIRGCVGPTPAWVCSSAFAISDRSCGSRVRFPARIHPST